MAAVSELAVLGNLQFGGVGGGDAVTGLHAVPLFQLRQGAHEAGVGGVQRGDALLLGAKRASVGAAGGCAGTGVFPGLTVGRTGSPGRVKGGKGAEVMGPWVCGEEAGEQAASVPWPETLSQPSWVSHITASPQSGTVVLSTRYKGTRSVPSLTCV